MEEKQPVAVFDVDGTIFRSSLLVEVVNACIEKELFPKEAQSHYERQLKLWSDRQGEYSDYIQGVITAFMSNIKGVHYGDFVDVARQTVFKQQKRTYRYTRDLVVDLKKRGYFLLAISHSPKAILDLFCPQLGFDKVYGMMYDIGPSDRFTGTVTDISLILNKAHVLERAVQKSHLTYDGSVGVGDTESDISFLELVDTPICFNPNNELYTVAKRKSWKVVVERKDVIYEI